jgi:hypothetical protein
MRTKTLILSALLGALGSVAVNAQTNVYSLNAVGYVNVTVPVGYTLFSVPLIASPDNTIGTLLNNASGAYTADSIFTYNTTTGGFVLDEGEPVGGRGGTTNTNGWAFNGTNILAPGVGAWYYNASTTNKTLTFVGTVPSGSLTNTLLTGYNLVGSILPVSGDIVTNTLSTLTNYNLGDSVFSYANPPGTFTIFQSGTNRGQGGFGYEKPGTTEGNWTSVGDPTTAYVG